MIQKHHIHSPSRLEKTRNCPWSAQVCKGWESPNTEDADYGNLMHKAIWDDPTFETLSEPDREIIETVRKEHIDPFREIGEHFSELPVEVRDETGTLITSGFLDYLIVNGNFASLKDWKFGGYEVSPAAYNMQIKAYVAGIFQKFPEVETIFALIVQPIFWHGDYDDQQAEFRRDQLPQLLAEIKSTIELGEKATEEDAVCRPANCKNCNREKCGKYNSQMVSACESYGIERPESNVPEKDMVDFCDEMLCKAKLLEDMLKGRKELFQRVVLDAGGSANFRVQEGRVSKKTDWARLCREQGINDGVIAKYTTETTGNPYLMPRMRKPKQLKG